MSANLLTTRRNILKGGSLVISFSLFGIPFKAHAQIEAAASKPLTLNAVDSFLAIDPKGMVTVYSGKVDLGTGVQTALAQIVADELDVPLQSITIIQGDTALTPDQGTTWGSLSIQIGGIQIRNASAVARSKLLRPCFGKAWREKRRVDSQGWHNQRRRKERQFWRTDRRQVFLLGSRPEESSKDQGSQRFHGGRHPGPPPRYPCEGNGHLHLHAGFRRPRYAAWAGRASARNRCEPRKRRRGRLSAAYQALLKLFAKTTFLASLRRMSGPRSKLRRNSRPRGRNGRACQKRQSSSNMFALRKS